MTQIPQLSALDTIQGGDLLIVYANNNGDARKSSITLLQDYMQNNLAFSSTSGVFTTQYSSPSSSSFNVVLTDGSNNNTNIHLILTPTSAFAQGTITLPPVSGLDDKQEVLFNCTQDVTTFTVNGNGAGAVTGAPSTLSSNDFFKLKYDKPTDVWYRVG